MSQTEHRGRRTWVILTGEYPPQKGGVADYTARVASGLARRGDIVHVVAPSIGSSDGSADPSISVQRLEAGRFGPRGLQETSRRLCAIRRRHPEATMLVQYVPHAYGRYGINPWLPVWVAAQRNVWVLFHEVSFGDGPGVPYRERALAKLQHWQARALAARAQRRFVTTPAWRLLLQGLGVRGSIEWLPVPSNVPTCVPEAARHAARSAVAGAGVVVGHFGTYAGSIASHVRRALEAVLAARPDATALLIGRGGDGMRRTWIDERPELGARVVATGGLSSADVAAHLAACDLLLQPFPDGLSCRRTTVMAGLALGVPIVSNQGPATEELWRCSGGVRLTEEPGVVGHAALELLADSDARSALSGAGRELYEQRFSLERLTDTLRA